MVHNVVVYFYEVFLRIVRIGSINSYSRWESMVETAGFDIGRLEEEQEDLSQCFSCEVLCNTTYTKDTYIKIPHSGMNP